MSGHGNVVPLDLPAGQMDVLCGAVGLAARLNGSALVDANATGETPAAREAMKRLMREGSRKEHELILTSPALLGLMRLGASKKCRMQRTDLVSQSGSGGDWRMHGDDLAMLLRLRYVELRSQWVEITDRGNALVRDLLTFARGWEGGGL